MEIAIKKLGEIITGNTPSKKEDEYWNSADICFVKPDGIADEGITLVNASNEYISEKARAKARVVSKDSVFVTCIGTIGKIGIAGDGDYAFNQQINVIVPNERVIPRYLAYNLLYSKPKLSAIANAPVVPIINKTQFSDFTINIEDDRKKQADIVAVLDKLMVIIDARRKEVEELDDLIKARFVEMFGDPEHNNKGWSVKKLNDLCSIGSSKRIYQEEQTIGGIPFWRISDLVAKMDTGNVDSSLYIPESRYDELKAQGLVPEPGDILVTSRGTLGRCYIISPDDRFYFQDGMISWLSKYTDEITPLYIQYLFDMPGFRKQIDGMQAGSTVAYLSIAMLKKLNIMLPDIELQERFAAFIAQTDKSKVAVQKGLDKTQVLFDSLMQEYFG